MAGSYLVTASVPGGTSSASFALTNDAGALAIAFPISGTPQSATVSTPFNAPLEVKLTDAFGNPEAGLEVSFVAPGSGPSATFPPNGNTSTVVTDENGIASIDATANANAGTYLVSASSDGLLTDVEFLLTNSTQQIPIVVTTSGEGQVANVTTAFNCLLQLKLTDSDGLPISGQGISFSAPLTGPSATLSDGTTSGQSVTVDTASNGFAGITATANGTPGSYDISASMQGNLSVIGSFTLTNLNLGDIIFKVGGGFETWARAVPVIRS